MKCVDCGRRISIVEIVLAFRLLSDFRCMPKCQGMPDSDRSGMVAFLAVAVALCIWLVAG